MNGKEPNFLSQTPVQEPPQSPPSTHSNAAYLEEKRNGSRLPNGAKPLKRLNAQHKEILKMHLSGLSNNEISEQSGKTFVSISRIINDPLARAEIDRLLQDTQHEFTALYSKSIGRLREAMDAETMGKLPAHTTRLKAVDIYFKASGKYVDNAHVGETAEDVIARILANPLIQVNINTTQDASSKQAAVADPAVDDDDSILEGELSHGEHNSG